ncbi:MAG: ABC transporter ATP-binding protein [Candidatus Saccharimonadales bacterium]
MPAIELKEVSKLYGFGDATTVALDEVSLTIESGEFVAVMGPSGSGKSTLMNMIGLLDRPTHGDYKLGERYVSRMRMGKRARLRRDTIGFVFQSFNLLPTMTVLENVALPLAYKGMSRTRRLKQAGRVLDRVGLSDREYFYPYQLSGGQAQRVAIARALVNNPSIIIADEPTGNLDSAASRVIMELLSDVHKTGSTVLMVTHNPELTRYSTRVVFMRDGAIMLDEESEIGQLPETVRRRSYFVSKKSVEDDLAGVSAIMKTVEKEPKKVPHDKPSKKKHTKSKTYKARATTRKKKS